MPNRSAYLARSRDVPVRREKECRDRSIEIRLFLSRNIGGCLGQIGRVTKQFRGRLLLIRNAYSREKRDVDGITNGSSYYNLREDRQRGRNVLR